MATTTTDLEVIGKDPAWAVIDEIANIGRESHRTLSWIGGMAVFAWQAIVAIPWAIRNYGKEIQRQIGELSLGSGALLTFTGTILVVIAEAIFVGVEVGVQGFESLNLIGIAPLSGFLAAIANTREIAPLICAIAIASQVGCKFTAQLGAQRTSEEIDALEVMSIRPIPYLVTTRMIAAFTVFTPLYLLGLLGSYLAPQLIVTWIYGQSSGTYLHYFNQFLRPEDVLYSVLKVVVFTTFIITFHTYYGFKASGGPVGVGIATARAIRLTLVTIAISDVLMTMLFWGLGTVPLSGAS